MKYHYRLVQDGESLTIHERHGIVPRVLGLPFLISAGYIWYGAWLIVESHIRAGSIFEPAKYLPMVAFLLFSGALFAWPGFSLTLHFRRLTLRKNLLEIVERNSYLFFCRTKIHRRELFNAVTMQTFLRASKAASRESGGDSPTVTPHKFLSVMLSPKSEGEKSLRLGIGYNKEQLMPLATAASQFLGLPLRDELGSVVME